MAKKHRAVLVTTVHRGVFFGYAGNTDGETIKLSRARNCIYWRGIKGFLALAETGPTKDCRVGPPADIELRGISCVAECTPVAVAAWEKGHW